MKALALLHATHEGLGALADWLPAAGLELEVRHPHRGDEVPAELTGYDALVVMGGPMGVMDADRLPYLTAEMDLLRSAVAARTPTLAICLGAQLLAAANGGAVQKGRIGPELGVCMVAKRDVAAADELFADVPFLPQVVQWHWDEIVTLPPNATLLASSPAYPHQAFRVGDLAWGLQFHPETPPAMVAVWAEQDAEGVRAAGLDPDSVVAEATAAWPDLEAVWRPVAQRFAALAVAHAESATRR
jgi:GMP synthase-like glutamine amidotransferase